MTREEAKEFYTILQAYAEGKVIECRRKPSLIEGSDTPNDWTEPKAIAFWRNTEYRIKPEVIYRPFDNAQECIEEMRRHEPFGWVKSKPDVGDYCSSVMGIRYGSAFNFIKLRGSWMNTNIVFENYTFLDGSPFGVKVEDKEE